MRSLRGIQMALYAAFALYIVANSAALAHFLTFSLGGPTVDIAALEKGFAAAGQIGSMAFFLGGASLLIWTHLVAANLAAARLQDLVYAPKWSVLGFVVPLINLVRPHDVMAEFWRASRFIAAPGQFSSWRDVPSSKWVLAWWLCFTPAWILSIIQITGPFNVTPVQLLGLSPFYLIRIAAAVLTILVVHQISRLHEKALARP